MSNCTYNPHSNEPCATCPRKISTLYKCELLKETARETAEELNNVVKFDDVRGPKTPAEAANWCIANALRLNDELKVSIAAKIMQHLSKADRERVLRFCE